MWLEKNAAKIRKAKFNNQSSTVNDLFQEIRDSLDVPISHSDRQRYANVQRELDELGMTNLSSNEPANSSQGTSNARGPKFGPQAGISAGQSTKDYGRKIALLIGVSDYKYLPTYEEASRNDELADLQFAEKDARDFAELINNSEILGPGWEVHLLAGKQATEVAIGDKIDELFAGALNEQDLIYFFFAGHGRNNPSNNRDIRLLAWDSDPSKNRAGINYSSLRDNFFNANAGYGVAFIDACRSGSVGFGRGADRPDQDLLGNVYAQRPTKVIFTAGSGTQRAFEDPQLQNGVFTHYLLRGMRGEADNKDQDEFVDLQELEQFVADNVSKHTRDHPKMARQIPRLFDPTGLYADRFPIAIRSPQ